jgi:iron complex outermembrane receptor protein
MKYRDQLVLTGQINDVGAYTRTNIRNSFRLGLELQGTVKASEWLTASGNITFSRNRISHLTEYIDDYDNGGQKQVQYDETDISFSPSIIGAATITVKAVKNLDIDLLEKYVGDQYLDNTSNKSRMLDAYFLQDIRFVYSFSKKWLKKASVVLQVNNVFSKKYEPNGYTFSYYYGNELTTENFYFPMAGRNAVVGLNIRF